MPEEETADLERFMQPFSPAVCDAFFRMRKLIWKLYPKANELIYDSYQAVAAGWSVTDRLSHTFCSIAAYRTSNNLHFGFYWGKELSDPEKKLLGEGNQYRYFKGTSYQDFPWTYIRKLLKEAYANSLAKVKDPKQIVEGMTITKAVYAKKRVAAPAKKPGAKHFRPEKSAKKPGL